MENTNYQCVIGIDFGTSRSGFAWGYVGDKNEVHGNSNWPDYKTDSAILLEKEGEGDMNQGAKLTKIYSFGLTAIQDYNNMKEEPELCEQFELFRYYKMALYRKEENVSSVRGNFFPVVDVFSFALQWLKNESLTYMDKFHSSSIKESEVQWIITLPAIWSDEAKSIMRKCAHQAEIIDEESSRQLILIHEPEAAGIEGYIGSQKIVDEEVFHEGKVMILDAGSGTIDITIMQIDKTKNNEKNIHILIAAKGGSMGSSIIDQKFIEFVEDFLDSKEKLNIGKLGDLFDSWINIKHCVTQRFAKSRMGADLNFTENLLKNKPLKYYADKWNKKYKLKNFLKCSKINKTKLKVPKKFFYSLFEEPVNEVIECLKQIFVDHKNLSDIKNILMVGSYSNCPILESKVRETFETKDYNIKVIKGTHPGRAIVCGAVRHGLKPYTIQSRTYDYAYGINWCCRFNPKVHKESKKLNIEGDLLCLDCFQTLIKKNVPIKRNHVIRKLYTMVGDELLIEIYRSKVEMSEDTVYYVDDDGFEKFGSALIEKLKKSGKNDNITIEFKFGRTMIELEVTNKSNNSKYLAKIDYDDKKFN
ncbi:hsp70 family protein [Anaeramoeba flamelloides]|uniref:Hsp70 family protein n=1 Tax=Anaeramoeba flamelloides TaxID=1746091 RepID=A0ABQ8YBE0_9EUKA|nr:hsp70 family protein [Anaeramoeba flamelloides]